MRNECTCDRPHAGTTGVILAALVMFAASVGAAFAAEESAAKLRVTGQVEARQYHSPVGPAALRSDYFGALTARRGPVSVDFFGRVAAETSLPADDYRRLDLGGELRFAVLRGPDGAAGLVIGRETRHSVGGLRETRGYAETTAGVWAETSGAGWRVRVDARAVRAQSNRSYLSVIEDWIQIGDDYVYFGARTETHAERGNVPRARAAVRVEAPEIALAGVRAHAYVEARGVLIDRVVDYWQGPQKGYAEGVLGARVDLTPQVYLDFRASHERRPEDSVTLSRTRNVASVAAGVRW